MNAGAPAAAVAAGRFGRFELLPAERRLELDGRTVPLGSRAFDLLTALVARRERVVSKDELLEVVWPGLIVEDNNLQVQISALRKLLGASAIATIPGRGYQFTIAALASEPPKSEVPAIESPVARIPAHLGSAGGRPCRLLVADDNKVNRLLLCRSLELMGHELACADNGRTALEKLRSEPFDLLLLDLEMPELDGFGLLAERARDPRLLEVPVIVTSSLEGAAHVARCIELGADDYLHKPVNPMLLKARVDSSLERKQLRDRQRELLARLLPGAAQGDASVAGAAAGCRLEATLLVARLCDVEALAGSQPVHETLDLLGSWTTLMLDAAEAHGGRLTRLAGDGIAAVFGAARRSGPLDPPDPLHGEGGAAWAAVQAAREMRELVALFNAERAASGRPPTVLGVGIASGAVVAGHAAAPRREAYVCVGAAVQRAEQLEAVAAARPGGAVLLDDATCIALAGRAPTQSLASMALPASPAGIPVHVLTAAAPPAAAAPLT